MPYAHLQNALKGEMDMLKCRQCRICDGVACRGEIPGLGGIGTGSSFVSNVLAMQKVKLNMDVIADSEEIDTSCTLFGLDLSMPVFAAPIAGIRNNYGADIDDDVYTQAMLDACETLGIRGFTGDGIDADKLFAVSARMIDAHQGHGAVTIKPWVQSGIDERIQILRSLHFEMAAMDIDAAGLPLLRAGKTPVETKNIEKLRYVKEQLNKPFIVKGIMTVHAAMAAAEAGADGIVVSNHGGRVLDGTPGTIDVLPEIAAAIKGRLTILIDGGIRSGTDIFRCLALGADGVLVGRPFALAAVTGGSEGLVSTAEKYRRELIQAMRMTGCHTLKDITADKIKVMK